MSNEKWLDDEGNEITEEYVIISKTAIQKRIEKLRKDSIHVEWEHDIKTHNGHSPKQRERKKIVDVELNTLEEILSQSTPLIPEIEKAWEHGYTRGYNLACCESVNSDCLTPNKEDYISNLKLDI